MQHVRTTPPYASRVSQNYRYFAKKISEKNMQKNSSKNAPDRRIVMAVASTFAIFGGSKMSLQKLSERQHDFKSFPKTRQDDPR